MAELTLHRLRAFEGSVADAYEAAGADHEPLFVPAQLYADDRGWSLMNQLQGVMGPDGQVNYSVMYPQVIKAWHRHEHQSDFWMCVMGHIKVGVYREDDNCSWKMVIGEKRAGVLIVPPLLWHGAATVSSRDAGLLYYVTQTYDSTAPDEQRRAHDSVKGFSWQVSHG